MSENNLVQRLVDEITAAIGDNVLIISSDNVPPKSVVPVDIILPLTEKHAALANEAETKRIADQVAANEAHAEDSIRANEAEQECRARGAEIVGLRCRATATETDDLVAELDRLKADLAMATNLITEARSQRDEVYDEKAKVEEQREGLRSVVNDAMLTMRRGGPWKNLPKHIEDLKAELFRAKESAVHEAKSGSEAWKEIHRLTRLLGAATTEDPPTIYIVHRYRGHGCILEPFIEKGDAEKYRKSLDADSGHSDIYHRRMRDPAQAKAERDDDAARQRRRNEQSSASMSPSHGYTRSWAAAVDAAGYTPGGPLGLKEHGPTADAIARAAQVLQAMVNPGRELGEALLEAVQQLAKRMDATEGDTFNLLKAIHKLEGSGA